MYLCNKLSLTPPCETYFPQKSESHTIFKKSKKIHYTCVVAQGIKNYIILHILCV